MGSSQRVISSSCYFNTNDFDFADNTFRGVNIIRGEQTLAVAVGLCQICTLYHKYMIQKSISLNSCESCSAEWIPADCQSSRTKLFFLSSSLLAATELRSWKHFRNNPYCRSFSNAPDFADCCGVTVCVCVCVCAHVCAHARVWARQWWDQQSPQWVQIKLMLCFSKVKKY